MIQVYIVGLNGKLWRYPPPPGGIFKKKLGKGGMNQSKNRRKEKRKRKKQLYNLYNLLISMFKHVMYSANKHMQTVFQN